MAADSLRQILLARDNRVVRQRDLMARYGKSVLSVTLVTPGPVKNGPIARRLMETALQEIDSLCQTRAWPVLERNVLLQDTGPEAIYALDVDAKILKSGAVGIETHHPLGRLWDLDVMTAREGRLSRSDLGLPPRLCLICARPAHECARSQRHPLNELAKAIDERVNKFDRLSPA